MPGFDDLEDDDRFDEFRAKRRQKFLVILGLLSIGIGIGGYIIAFVI